MRTKKTSLLKLSEFTTFMTYLVVQNERVMLIKHYTNFWLLCGFDVVIDDGYERIKYHLNRAYYGLYICPMVWREIDNFPQDRLYVSGIRFLR